MIKNTEYLTLVRLMFEENLFDAEPTKIYNKWVSKEHLILNSDDTKFAIRQIKVLKKTDRQLLKASLEADAHFFYKNSNPKGANENE